MSDHPDMRLIKALRNLRWPEPRAGFVDRALQHAMKGSVAATPPARFSGLRRLLHRRETWLGAALGAACAAAVTLLLVRPAQEAHRINLALNEARNVDVLINSEKMLEDATIHIAVSGGVVLDGFDNEHEIDWRANLESGSNLLSLPIVARSAGRGRLVAVVEYEGKKRTVAVDLQVTDTGA